MAVNADFWFGFGFPTDPIKKLRLENSELMNLWQIYKKENEKLSKWKDQIKDFCWFDESDTYTYNNLVKKVDEQQKIVDKAKKDYDLLEKLLL